MKAYLLCLFMLFALVGCKNKHTTETTGRSEPSIYTVSGDDAEMNEAIKTARQTLHKFNKALNSSKHDYMFFSLKVRFETPNGWEHIWVSQITFKDNQYFGFVDNLPASTTDVKAGDRIQIADENISDWMYVANQKLYGGYTIRLLRKRMTEEERNQFDAEYGLIIKD